ncbi:hypothetical protein ASPBRDRAFT_196316 [Aspergillus brasiliensis CBS 101740]|uniref:AB hydrolase-1 domain-containing protein n=1 Tax=Aspergillus brasiliensis (strain CBS 101740 / IMI 381727 / IBT 21946) TaxID=767769 RepID=A0A1L9UKP3_ASPBC|nr:hypothetical protein ASPBRDRAFT_196316 [Aspergillus brasiliensis CBS 101740]
MADHTHLLEFVAEKRFHQRIVLPAAADHGPLAVTYADIGPRTREDGSPTPTMLLIQGMAGSRLWCCMKDHLANKLGVRMLSIDRPGIGGSTPVPPAKRVSVWLKAVSAVLEHLSIAHVVPISHSAGTIYNLNLLSHRRDLLLPETPMAILMGPWVEPKYSDILSLQMAKMLPTGVLNHWNKVIKFVVTKAAPSLTASVDILSSMGGISRAPEEGVDGPELSADELNSRTAEKLEDLCIEYIFLEDTTGFNDETVVCLKKAPGLWGACEDLPVYIRGLVQAEERYKQSHPEEKPLEIKAIFAEKDGMIGPKGQKYFEDCFANADLKSVVTFESVMEKGTTHDSLWASETGAFLKMLKDIQGAISQ